MKRVNDGDRRDRVSNRAHSLEELVLDLVGADDGPVGAVVQHLAVRLLRAGGSLEINILESIPV